MQFKRKFCNVLAAACLGLIPLLEVENSQIPGYDDGNHAFDYNRLRAQIRLGFDCYPDFSATVAVDNESWYRSAPGSLENRSSIYRAYVEYQGESHSLVLGKQRVPLGVGRFWNPVDVFNPIDIEAVEPEERPGTETIRYEYALNALSGFDVNLARKKGAVRIKGYLDFADIALLGIWDDARGYDITGWELEGELGSTGVELRSEGGIFHNHQSGERHTEFIVGAEYGFANSLTISTEYYASNGAAGDALGTAVQFRPAMLLSCSVTTVFSFDDSSGFVSPVLEYSLSDEMTLSAGLFHYFGAEDSLYGADYDRLYLRWFIHF